MTDASIVAAAESRYWRHPPVSLTTLQALGDVANLVLDDAGVSPADVDGLGVASFSLAPDHAIDLALRLGLRARWLMDCANGGASGVDMLQHAMRAVEAGDAECILLLAGDVMSPEASRQLGAAYNTARRDHLTPIDVGSNPLFALLTRRHMSLHHLTRADYGVIPVTQREWARDNPNAAYRKALSIEDYLAAPLVADPLCIFDCVPIVGGADAIIVAASDNGVRVLALMAAHNADGHIGDGLRTGLETFSAHLWAEAGLERSDVDVVSVYDDYSVMVLAQLTDLGFGGPTAILSSIADGSLRVNTSGGQLSAGQAGAAGGMHGLVEVVRQLQGRAPGRQIADARVGLVAGYGMVAYRYGACANAAILQAPPA